MVALLAIFGRDLTKQGLKTMLVVAILAAAASGGRAVLAAVPSVQPASFIIMMTGILFGPGAGLICGVLTGLLSNLLIGMLWPFCAWHMLLWGVMGLVSGLLRRLPVEAHACIGLVWGFVFGWCMNLWYYTTGAVPFSWAAYLVICLSGFSFDLTHAATNFALLFLFTEPVQTLFKRMGFDNAHSGTGS